MNLYIDPVTGSMLFTLLMGLIGALNYFVRNYMVKLRFILSGGKAVEKNEKELPIVFFSDDRRYWSIFEPVCRELDKRKVDVVYMTASEDDPGLDSKFEHVKTEFIGKNNKAFAKLNMLNATMVVATTPGLDVYQWRRSKDVDFYVHLLHGANDVSGYRMFGLDYYDAVFLSGEYQLQDIRKLEKLRDLPAKELIKVGIPYMDEMALRIQNDKPLGEHERTILLAPSWGPSSIFQKYGKAVLDTLLKTGYHIIVRPHPQSFTAEKDLMDQLMKEYPESEQLEWNRDADNYEVLRKSDLLISDFSGVVFDFSLVHHKPVIYADTEFDLSPYDAWWLDEPYWTLTALPRIGQKLNEENLSKLKEMIDDCIDNPKYMAGIEEVISETWEHQGESTKLVADYLIKKYNELRNKKNIAQ